MYKGMRGWIFRDGTVVLNQNDIKGGPPPEEFKPVMLYLEDKQIKEWNEELELMEDENTEEESEMKNAAMVERVSNRQEPMEERMGVAPEYVTCGTPETNSLYEELSRLYMESRRLRLTAEVAKIAAYENKADAEHYWNQGDSELDKVEEEQKKQGHIVGLGQMINSIRENMHIARDYMQATIMRF